MEGFQNHIHPNWSSYYNLIFMGPNFGNIFGQEPLEIVSHIRYNRRDYGDLNPNEQQNCYNLNILVMEIHLVIKLIVQQIKLAKIPQWSDALNSYNLFDKFEKLFHNLFEFHITHTRHNLSMSLYRKVRNCIAHHGGSISRMRYQKRISEYASERGILIDDNDQKELKLSHDFNKEVCDTMMKFFSKLQSAYYGTVLPED